MVEHTGHTPGPWVVDPNFPDDIQDSFGNEIATLFNSDDVGELLAVTGSIPHSAETSGANAAFIVHAVNCHADLVAALEKAEYALSEFKRYQLDGKGTYDGNLEREGLWTAFNSIRAALAKARAQ